MEEIHQGLLPVELMIGNACIDNQHDEIFCRIEALKESSLVSGEVTDAEVASLVACFRTHFATEEQLADQAGMEFSCHAHEHSRALCLLTRAGSDLCNGRLDLRTFLRYLEYWFEQHINEFDKPFGSRLHASNAIGWYRVGTVSSAASSLVVP